MKNIEDFEFSGDTGPSTKKIIFLHQGNADDPCSKDKLQEICLGVGISYNEVIKPYHQTEQNATTPLCCWSAAGDRGLIFRGFRWKFSCSIFDLKQDCISE